MTELCCEMLITIQTSVGCSTAGIGEQQVASVDVLAPAVQTVNPAVPLSVSLSQPQATMPFTVQGCPQVLTVTIETCHHFYPFSLLCKAYVFSAGVNQASLSESLATLMTGMMAQTGSLGQPLLIPFNMAGSITGQGGLAVLTLPTTNVATLPGLTAANSAGNLLKLPFAGLQGYRDLPLAIEPSLSGWRGCSSHAAPAGSPGPDHCSTAASQHPGPNYCDQPQQAVSSEEGINLEEIREFAKNFKIRRLSLGLTQTQVGQALTATEGPAYSQFEKLDITPKSAQKLKPVLEKWLAEAEHWNQKGQQNLMEFVGGEPSKKRKRRTSFTPQAIEVLNSYFEKNALPTGQEITEIARELNYDREVVRVWFCNRRQTLKNTSKINVFQV
ncbi:hypothetical protein XENOCAPTIV_016846 [Xenoophorus captivus]|uniref:POU domain protein n=1 Tax=Xenoophorus captivus TaxID=1517983 RepID=A0ABV0RUW0_9TELE